MQKFLIIVLVLINLSSVTKADDIKDFEIEGFYIGDSLLETYSEEALQPYKRFMPGKFSIISIPSSDYNGPLITVDTSLITNLVSIVILNISTPSQIGYKAIIDIVKLK